MKPDYKTDSRMTNRIITAPKPAKKKTHQVECRRRHAPPVLHAGGQDGRHHLVDAAPLGGRGADDGGKADGAELRQCVLDRLVLLLVWIGFWEL